MSNVLQLEQISVARTSTEQAILRLVEAIALGGLKSRQRLVEREVSEALGVSRVPVREAIKQLLADGVLEQMGPRRVCVADFSRQRVDELKDLRIAIEGLALSQTMERLKDQKRLLHSVEGLLQDMKSLPENCEPIEYGRVDLAIHRELLRLSGNRLVVHIWEGLANRILITFCKEWDSANSRLSEITLHEKLLADIKNGDPDEAHSIMRRHILSPVG